MGDLRLAAGFAATLLLSACVHAPAPAYQPGLAGLQALRGGESPLAVDAATAAPGVPNERLSLRGNTMTGTGADGTFSTYLQEALETELRNAGRLDDAAALRVAATLTTNRLDAAGASTGRGTVGARFVVTRAGRVVYDATHTVEHTWESSFIGAIAIPAAMQGYSATVQKLAATLFADPAFRDATR